MSYNIAMAETTAIEIGVSKLTLANSRSHAVFFRSSAIARRFQWSGLGGETFGSAGSQSHRYANPALCPATPIGVGSRVLKPDFGGRTVRPVSAHPEHPQSIILALINEALSDAATAPTYQAALDITGDTLRLLADLVRREVRS